MSWRTLHCDRTVVWRNLIAGTLHYATHARYHVRGGSSEISLHRRGLGGAGLGLLIVALPSSAATFEHAIWIVAATLRYHVPGWNPYNPNIIQAVSMLLQDCHGLSWHTLADVSVSVWDSELRRRPLYRAPAGSKQDAEVSARHKCSAPTLLSLHILQG